MNALAIATKKTIHTTEEGGVVSSLYARGEDLGVLMVNPDGSAVAATTINGVHMKLTGATEAAVIEQVLSAWGVTGKRTLALSSGAFDTETSFLLEVPGSKGPYTVRAKLHCGYETENDGQHWAMGTSGSVKAHYTSEDRRERARLNVETPIKNGDIVAIGGEDYRVEVLGDFSNAALFHKVA